MSSILKVLTSYLVYATDGNVDVDSTMSNVQAELQLDLERVAEQDRQFASIINRIFDNHTGDRGIPTKWLCGKVAAIVAQGDDEREKVLIGEVASFIERSPRFDAKRGKTGGLFRVG